jgi:hypothetical protein
MAEREVVVVKEVEEYGERVESCMIVYYCQ